MRGSSVSCLTLISKGLSFVHKFSFEAFFVVPDTRDHQQHQQRKVLYRPDLAEHLLCAVADQCTEKDPACRPERDTHEVVQRKSPERVALHAQHHRDQYIP